METIVKRINVCIIKFLNRSEINFYKFKIIFNMINSFYNILNIFNLFNLNCIKTISSRKNKELTTKADTDFIPDGVYILHETLGVRTVDTWDPKNNDGVVGILLIEDDYKIVVATEDAPDNLRKDDPNNLRWSDKSRLINQPVEKLGDAKSDFNGEYYCQKFNSPDFPAAYYCKTYNKGNHDWYLPSSGELRLIYNHLEEIQTALSIVGGQKFVTAWDKDVPVYWSSTEYSAPYAWTLDLSSGGYGWYTKVNSNCKVRPVSNFDMSFTKKISRKMNDELILGPNISSVHNGVYILHETIGVRTVNKWNTKDNEGVVGILVVDDEHKIVVALEDFPENIHWSKKHELVNKPVYELEDAKSDFNGEYYCQKLNSPNYPAIYYCKIYGKGNRNWYLPSSGELWLIYNHLEEIQIALDTVGGQRLVTTWDKGVPIYWSSTENSAMYAWVLDLTSGYLDDWGNKVNNNNKVRPISKFNINLK